MTTCQTADVLSVSEAVAYMRERWGCPYSVSTVRRLLKGGYRPATATASGHLGVTRAHLDARFTRPLARPRAEVTP